MIKILLLRLLNPWVWRNPRSTARKLNDFAKAERGSMLDLMLASRLTDSPERKSLYLRHGLDEARHTNIFRTRARELLRKVGLFPPPAFEVDTEALFQNLGELKFLAFVHAGENLAVTQFEEYRRYFQRKEQIDMEELFAGLLVDEQAHAAYTWDELVALAGSEKEARRALRRIRLWELGRSYLRAGRTLSRLFYKVTMLLLFTTTFPLALLIRLTRPVPRGWQGGEKS